MNNLPPLSRMVMQRNDLKIRNIIQASLEVKQQLLADDATLKVLETVVEASVNCLRAGGKLLFCGNGGSAADAQHIAAELSGRFYLDRKALFAESLHSNSSYLTAVANDYGYDAIFARAVEAKGRPGDLLFGLSTSGNSGNVVKAMEKAQEVGMITIALTGQGGGKLAQMVDYLLAVPSTDTPRIQESHILLGHILCELVEKEMA